MHIHVYVSMLTFAGLALIVYKDNQFLYNLYVQHSILDTYEDIASLYTLGE